MLNGSLLLDAEARLLQQLQRFLDVGQFLLRRLELEFGVKERTKSDFGGTVARSRLHTQVLMLSSTGQAHLLTVRPQLPKFDKF